MERDILMMDGLQPLPRDDRDFTVGAIIDLPKLSDIPDSFKVPYPTEPTTQGPDTCAGHSTAIARSAQEGVLIAPLLPWIHAREKAGYKEDAFGIDLRSIASSHCEIGALEVGQEPFTDLTADTSYRNIANWRINDLLKLSVVHKAHSFVKVEPSNGYDLFDTIRATLWKFRDQKVVVVVGLRWPYPGDSAFVEKWVDGGYGHAVALVGAVDGKRLVELGSWGADHGDNGKFYLSREVINKEVPNFGAYFFIDETPENLKKIIAQGIKLDTPMVKKVLLKMYLKLLDLYKQLFAVTPKTGMPPYDWSSKLAVRHSIRVMCDEAGLPYTKNIPVTMSNGVVKYVSAKDIITACIYQESQFNPNAVGKPNNHLPKSSPLYGSRDHGLCQYNDGRNSKGVPLWIGPGATFKNVEEVYNNPEKNVRIMIDCYKKGRIGWWASYSTGAYKKWL